jgi:hypothetical protein
MDAFAAITIRKKMNLIAHDSPLAATTSHTPATKALPPLTLSLQNFLINSTISTPKAKFYGVDLSNFYRMTPMKEYEYMHICLDLIPNKIVQCYNLHKLVDNQG